DQLATRVRNRDFVGARDTARCTAPEVCNVLLDSYLADESLPDDDTRKFVRGLLYERLGGIEVAIELFQEIRKTSNRSHLALGAYLMMGGCFAQKDHHYALDMAIKLFESGLRCSGFPKREYIDLRYSLALGYCQKGWFDEALAQFHEIHAIDAEYE